MKLTVELNKQIVQYLTSLPSIENETTRHSLVSASSLDERLRNLVSFSAAGTQHFIQNFISILVQNCAFNRRFLLPGLQLEDSGWSPVSDDHAVLSVFTIYII